VVIGVQFFDGELEFVAHTAEPASHAAEPIKSTGKSRVSSEPNRQERLTR
jgi:hypothetical protein